MISCLIVLLLWLILCLTRSCPIVVLLLSCCRWFPFCLILLILLSVGYLYCPVVVTTWSVHLCLLYISSLLCNTTTQSRAGLTTYRQPRSLPQTLSLLAAHSDLVNSCHCSIADIMPLEATCRAADFGTAYKVAIYWQLSAILLWQHSLSQSVLQG